MIQLTKAVKQVPEGGDQHFEYIWVLPLIPVFFFLLLSFSQFLSTLKLGR